MQPLSSIVSKGHLAMAQRSEEGREEWAAEQAEDLQETGVEVVRLSGPGFGIKEGEYLPSQRMHWNGWQGSQMTSLPVSM